MRVQLRAMIVAAGIAVCLAAPARAWDAGSDPLKAEIDQFLGGLEAKTHGVVSWEGSDPYEVKQDGAGAVAVINHARLSIHILGKELAQLAFDHLEIRRGPDPNDDKLVDFSFVLPAKSTLTTADGTQVKLSLKDANASIVAEAQSGHLRQSASSLASARIEEAKSGSWINFGPLTASLKIAVDAKGGFTGVADMEWKKIEFRVPNGPAGGTMERIRYTGTVTGPSLADIYKIQAQMQAMSQHATHEQQFVGLLELLPALMAAYSEGSGEFEADGIAIRGPNGPVFTLAKGTIGSQGGFGGDNAALRITLKYDGLDLAASVLPADKVPHRVDIDLGVENVSTAALRAMIAATGKMNGSDADKQTATQQMMAAAALLHPTIRIYDIAADTQNVGIDITGTATGSPLSPKGYIADSDIRVRGFDAVPTLAAGAPMIEYLPLLKELGAAGPATDGAARVKFHVASAPTKWITINGNDVSEWFAAAAPAPGQTRLLKPAAQPIRGPDVAAAQNALAAANIPVDPTDAYDGPTAAAVARFQKQNGLTVNGVVDAATWQKLGVKAEATPSAPAPQPSTPSPPAAPNAAAESGVTGVWTAYDVGFPPWTLTLKADGAKLSGTVQQGARGSSGYTTLTMPVAIYDGEIDGNKITFKCQDPGHDRTITFTGIVNGDETTFTRTVLVKPGGHPGSNGIFGAAGAAAFTAQRVVPLGAASVPAEPDQRHADLGEVRFVNIDISGIANSELDWLLRPPRGHVKFDGIPFTILSGDRSVIHMHNRVRPDYPSTLRFPIGVASVAWVHLLLCGDWISNSGQHVGTVRISYSDGSSRDVPLISLEDIRETWMPNFSLPGHPFSRPPEGVAWKVAYSESQMRGGMASAAFLDRLSIRTDPARTMNEVSFLTNEPQTGMILIAMTLEITSGAVPSGAASAKPD